MIPQVCRSVDLVSPKISPHLRKPSLVYSYTFLFLFSTAKPKITIFDYLVNQHQFDPNLKASSITTKYIKNPEKSDSVLSFLKETGFSKTQIETVVKKMPQILSNDLEKTIKPKIKIFQGFGFDPNDIAQIVCADPWIFRRSADNRLGPSISILKRILGSNASVTKMLKKCGWALKLDLEKTMVPNIEFMRSCGISSCWIVEYMFSFPRIFLLKPETIEDVVKRIDEFGVDRKSKTYIRAIQVIGSRTKETWELKLKFFRNIGFSEEDIFSAFRRTPRVFALSERKVKDVIKFLLGEGNLCITDIVKHPELLTFSVEGRLRNRLRVFKVLESKNMLKRKTSLTTIYKIGNKQFLDKFVIPNLDEFGDREQ